MEMKHCQNCQNEHSCLRRVPLFMSLDAQEMDHVRKLIRHGDLRQGETLFRIGETSSELIVIRFGKVKIVRYDEQGSEIILEILKAGDYYGTDSLFHQNVYQDSGIALEDVGLCKIDMDDFRSLIQKDPTLALKIMKDLHAKIVQNKQLMEILFMKDTTQRVAQYLLMRNQNQVNNLLMLSQEEIGSAIHLTKETVNRKMARLQDLGLIAMEGKRRIHLLNPSQMALVREP